MSAGKDEQAGPQDEARSFEAGPKTSDQDIAGVMDAAGRRGEAAAGKIFHGVGEDPGVIEDSADSAQAKDETPGAGASDAR